MEEMKTEIYRKQKRRKLTSRCVVLLERKRDNARPEEVMEKGQGIMADLNRLLRERDPGIRCLLEGHSKLTNSEMSKEKVGKSVRIGTRCKLCLN